MPATPAKNEDPRRSARVFLFEAHYANLDEELRWNVDRLRRVCAALQLTEYELGAMIRVRIGEMARYISKNRFPATIELHLTLLERSIFPNTKPSVFPQCL